jgi:hypothetical protein
MRMRMRMMKPREIRCKQMNNFSLFYYKTIQQIPQNGELQKISRLVNEQ